MNIFHHIAVSKAGFELSGGEVCMINIIKTISERDNCFNVLYIPENGVSLYEKYFENCKNIRIVVCAKYWVERRFGVFVSYIYKAALSARFAAIDEAHHNNLGKSNDVHFAISHSDYFPDIAFTRKIVSRYENIRWISMFHMMPPPIFKGVKYAFVKYKYNFPSLNLIFHHINLYLYRGLLNKKNVKIVTVNKLYLEYFHEFDMVDVIRISSNALDYSKKIGKNHTKKYDLCFVGRFHPQKGLYELVDIVDILVKKNGRKGVRCVIIGGYDNKIGREFIKKIRDRGVEENFIMKGFLSGDEKFKVVSQSFVSVLPSYYESFGIVYHEAISLGVPVVEYDLPVYSEHKKGVLKIPFLDNELFANKVDVLLSNNNIRNKLSVEGVEYAKLFSWDSVVNVICENKC